MKVGSKSSKIKLELPPKRSKQSGSQSMNLTEAENGPKLSPLSWRDRAQLRSMNRFQEVSHNKKKVEEIPSFLFNDQICIAEDNSHRSQHQVIECIIGVMGNVIVLKKVFLM